MFGFSKKLNFFLITLYHSYYFIYIYFYPQFRKTSYYSNAYYYIHLSHFCYQYVQLFFHGGTQSGVCVYIFNYISSGKLGRSEDSESMSKPVYSYTTRFFLLSGLF